MRRIAAQWWCPDSVFSVSSVSLWFNIGQEKVHHRDTEDTKKNSA